MTLKMFQMIKKLIKIKRKKKKIKIKIKTQMKLKIMIIKMIIKKKIYLIQNMDWKEEIIQ